MNITEETKGNWTCLALTERLDTATAPELQKAGLKVLETTNSLALDCSQLAYISSAGLRVLLILGKKAKADGGSLVFCGACGMVKDILEESGMEAFFTSYGSAAELP